MKKGVLAFVLLFACLFLVGCGTKTQILSCGYSATAEGIAYTGTEDYTFKGKKVQDLKLTIKFDLSALENNKDAFDQAVDALRLEYSKAIEPGVTTNVYPEGNYVIAIFTFDPTTFDGYLNYMQKDMSSVFNTEIDIEEAKTAMTIQGYFCNIK